VSTITAALAAEAGLVAPACARKGSGLRIAVFGSFYRGFCVLSELLHGPLRHRVEVVGVATDDPAQPFVSASRRVWQYPHTRQEETMVADVARRHGLPVHTGRVKTPAFHATFEQDWRPDLCLMATFGQRIDARLFGYPRRGFYNFHPSDEGAWPSRYAGANPFAMMLADGAEHFVVSMHEVDAGLDTGARVAMSERGFIPPGATVVDLHKLSAPLVALLARRELARMLDAEPESPHVRPALATA
jgi:methionyl-tRNA formyltransferase